MPDLKKIVSIITAAALTAASGATALAEGTLIDEAVFDFQPHMGAAGQQSWAVDTDGVEYGSSQNAAAYDTVRPIPDDTIGPGGGIEGVLGIPNFVMHAGLLGLGLNDDDGNPVTHSGSRYVNLLFGTRIDPERDLTEQVARVEFDWKATITGTGDTMDTYFIGPGGVKYFGVRASYHHSSTAEPWGSTIDFIDGGPPREHPLCDAAAADPNRPQEWYHALLPDNEWYRISVTLDFETHRILEVTYKKYISADEPYFEDTPVITLTDLPFVDDYADEDMTSIGIGAVRLESIRGGGNISDMDWKIDNFKAYDVTGEYYKVTLNVKTRGGNPVEGAAVHFGDGDYVTDENGQIHTKVKPGQYEYTVKKDAYTDEQGNPDATGTVDVAGDGEVTEDVLYIPMQYDPIPATVTIEGGQSSLTAPHTDTVEKFTSAPFTVKVIDQENVERTPDEYTVKWAISPSDEHVSIDEDTGAVTVTKGFDGGEAHIKEFTVSPTVAIGASSDSTAETEIEVSDYLFYDSGKGGSSYGDPASPPRAHQIGEDGVYMTTSAGGDWISNENHVNDGRDYKGIINIPEPVEFTPDSVYELSFDTTSTAEVYTFGRSLILSDTELVDVVDENGDPVTDDETGEVKREQRDKDMLTIDYIRDGIGKRKIENEEDPQWNSKDNTFETEYGTLDGYNLWKHVSILFRTDSAGETKAAITVDDKTTDLGVMDAERLAKIKLSIEMCKYVTDRFAAFKNFIIRDKSSLIFKTGEFAGRDALVLRARYDADGALVDLDIENVTLPEEKLVVNIADTEPGTKVILWTEDKYTPVAAAQTVE